MTTTTPITLADLLQFCETDPARRPYLLKPFSDDKFTYASDGTIVIRVPFTTVAGSSVKEDMLAHALILIHEYFSTDQSTGDYQPLPVEPPEGWAPKCETCEGSGRCCKVVCDCCGNETVLPVEIDCLDCDGAGFRYWNVRVRVGDQDLNAHYLRKLSKLPNVRISPGKDEGIPASFVFDGGDGRLMPLRKNS